MTTATNDIEEEKSRGHKCFVVSVENDSPSRNNNNNNSNHDSCPPTSTSNKNKDGTVNVIHVVVIAHPDDESMFFLPTLTNLIQAGETVWLLCLTTGNYHGLGNLRKGELSRVCRMLQVSRLIQLEVETLRDHPSKAWNLDAVTEELERALLWTLRTHTNKQQQSPAPMIQKMILLTFDFQGVSGHINHRDTYLGVRNLIYQQQQKKAKHPDNKETTTLPLLEAWKLETVPLLPFKYMPLGSWFRLVLYMLCLWKPTYVPLPSQQQKRQSLSPPVVVHHHDHNSEEEEETTQQHNNNNTMVHVFRTVDCALSWKVMATHQSQWVWYRRLFVMFSCYTFVNKLRPVE
jgi:N-acetylglucosaminylphosphatidylinositol deacetylase